MKKIILTLALLSCIPVFGQPEANPTDFTRQIKDYDLSVLWHPETIMKTDDPDFDNTKKPEPLGFIGEDYQRFYIHFISIIKNKDNPYEYFVYGKTKVKNNICEFMGTITIKEAVLLNYPDFYPEYKQGRVFGEYTFYESDKPGAGVFTGKVTSDFVIDGHDKLHYDALMLIADGYSNNQFEGVWQSYQTKTKKPCNWGDCRIPDSGHLDSGTGGFVPREEYYDKGWQHFEHLGELTPEGEKARKAEEEEWWKK